MTSAWDLGMRPRRLSPAQLRAYKEVSVFRSLSQLRQKAKDYPDIGHLAAELEVPVHVRARSGVGGHVGLGDTTPTQLISYVVKIVPMVPEGPRNRARMSE